MKDFEHLFPLLFPFMFVGMWFFVLRMLSIMSGWTKLAERFGTTETFDGSYYRFQSGKMNQVNFSSSLEIGVNAKGLYLVPMIIFRPFHTALLIPWSEFQAEAFRIFFFKGYRLALRSFPGISIQISERTFEKMRGYVKLNAASKQESDDTQAEALK